MVKNLSITFYSCLMQCFCSENNRWIIILYIWNYKNLNIKLDFRPQNNLCEIPTHAQKFKLLFDFRYRVLMLAFTISYIQTQISIMYLKVKTSPQTTRILNITLSDICHANRVDAHLVNICFLLFFILHIKFFLSFLKLRNQNSNTNYFLK